MNNEQGMMNAELKHSTFADRYSLFDIQKGAPRPYGNLGPRFFNLELVSVLYPDNYRDGKFGAAFSSSICCICRLL